MRTFDSNLFEHEYVIKMLQGYAAELKTDKNVDQVTDKYACILTAFMVGQSLANLVKESDLIPK